MTTLVIVHCLVATSQSTMWHLDFVLTSYVVRKRELAHLGKLPPMSVHGSWPLFVSQVVAFVVICGRQSLFVGSHLHLLAGCGGGVVMGCGWCWHRVVVAAGSVVGLW